MMKDGHQVKVSRSGKPTKKIDRPPLDLNGKPAVVYRENLYSLINDNEIHLLGTPVLRLGG